jgi:hypothetical protein
MDLSQLGQLWIRALYNLQTVGLLVNIPLLADGYLFPDLPVHVCPTLRQTLGGLLDLRYPWRE